MSNSEAALALLRQKMQEKQLDYYLVGNSDPHNDEYVPAHWRYLAEVSGFSGSLGYLLVSQNFAGLWVDSRYHIQAERECSAKIQIFRIGKPGVPKLHEYWQQCLTAATKQVCLGFDGSCFSRSSLNKLLPVSASFGGLIDGESLGIDELWQDLRPAQPESPVYAYKLEYCGQSRSSKLEQVREQMAAAAYDYYPIPLLDNIAWLLNVRANDIDYSPVAISYLMLGLKTACWYIQKQRISAELEHELRTDIPELEIKPYSEFYDDCQALIRQEANAHFLINDRYNMRLLRLLLDGKDSVECQEQHGKRLERGTRPCPSNRDIITDLKAIKNATEQEQLRKVAAIDGAALTAFHQWLRPQPDTPQNNGTTLPLAQADANEYQLGQQIVKFRSQIAGELGKGESFAPIVGFGDNSALPHYSATAQTSRAVQNCGGWLLIDSGGQYLGGTTDMTRCFSLEADFAPPRMPATSSSDSQDLAEPNEELCHIYTLVLRGHLHLQNWRFPKGTLGVQLDTLARSPLWFEGLDYQHGTGHGVGNFLNVHEGPASISPYPLNEPLKAGMLVSNEPGYYREGSFGIRIENLLLVQVDKQDPNWLCFEPVSSFPYERELICLDKMTRREKLWVDNYHAKCLERILASGKLNAQQEAWLRWRCLPLLCSVRTAV